MTLPAIVAKPPAITHMTWERVMPAMNGFTVSGASVWPTKMFAAAESASVPVTPISLRMPHASAAITRCITPRW